MRAAKRLVAAAITLALISGCSAATEAAKKVSEAASARQASSELQGALLSDTSMCMSAVMQEGYVTCLIAFSLTNPTSKPIDLTYGQIYAEVDGKVFKAETDEMGLGAIDVISDSLNPEESKNAMAIFTVKQGATIQKIFIGSEPQADGADVMFDVNMVAEPAEG